MICCDWPHRRPCGPTGDDAVCACGCTGYDERCGTYTSNHPDDAGIPEGVIKGAPDPEPGSLEDAMEQVLNKGYADIDLGDGQTMRIDFRGS